MNQLITYLIEASVCLAIVLLFYRALLSMHFLFEIEAVLIWNAIDFGRFPIALLSFVQVSQASLDFTLPEICCVGQFCSWKVQNFSWCCCDCDVWSRVMTFIWSLVFRGCPQRLTSKRLKLYVNNHQMKVLMFWLCHLAINFLAAPFSIYILHTCQLRSLSWSTESSHD